MLTYQKSTVDVRKNVFLAPLQAISVEIITVVGSFDVVFAISLVKPIN
jgi:hypothetical protein